MPRALRHTPPPSPDPAPARHTHKSHPRLVTAPARDADTQASQASPSAYHTRSLNEKTLSERDFHPFPIMQNVRQSITTKLSLD